MSNCDNADVRDLLPDLVHGTLSPPTRAWVDAHLNDCAACRRELELVGAAQAVLARTPSVDIGRVVSALPKPPRARSRREAASKWDRLGAWHRAAAIGIVVATGAAIGLGTREWLSRPSASSRSAPGGAVAGGGGGPAPPSPPSRPQLAGSARAPATNGDASELVLAAGVQELDDAQLDALLREIEALDAVPSEEPLPVLPALAGELGEGGV